MLKVAGHRLSAGRVEDVDRQIRFLSVRASCLGRSLSDFHSGLKWFRYHAALTESSVALLINLFGEVQAHAVPPKRRSTPCLRPPA